ncbi:CSEP0145 putative effector protein [Blumeria hordei DH14]|uniref:CSEP0145 putative effector protein n=1 Tax=Blumeria graminis f. sp. hordei (strain DH14) TaxID=546991 RepID=N1JNH7_BLUG1|nr:CSEP0145 putative effector protein [Blumeria hordei DH14]
MKFLSTPLTVALAGFLLLAPAVYGENYYECLNDQKFSEQTIMNRGRSATIDGARYGDPKGPNEETCKASRFSITTASGVSTTYLVQAIDNPSSYRVYELQDFQWIECHLRQGSTNRGRW